MGSSKDHDKSVFEPRFLETDGAMFFQEDDDLYAEKARKQQEFAAAAPGVCDIGNIDEELRIIPGKTWREDQRRKEEVMIQNLEKNPTSICIDSGAGESVCPTEMFPDYATHETDKVGCLYRAAGGQELRNVGEKRPHFRTNGIQTAMTFQATTHVKKPLAAASKITANGNRIVLDDENSLSYIENKATGTKIPLKIENGVYVMEVAIDPVAPTALSPSGSPSPFRRQAK